MMAEAARRNGAIDDPVDPPAAGRATTRRSRSCGSTACARLTADLTGTQGPGRRRARRHQQDVLVRDAPARRWSWRSTSSAPASMLADAGPDVGLVAGGHARPGQRDGYQVEPDDVGVLLHPVRDDLGRHRQIQRNIVGERVLGLPEGAQGREAVALGGRA